MKSKSYEDITLLLSNDFVYSPIENINQMYDLVKSTIQRISWNFIDEDLFLSIIKNHKRGTKYWLCERCVFLKHYLINHDSKREF